MALAGTAAVDAPSLFESRKDVEEHEIVVRDIESRLKLLGQVARAATKEWKLAPLKHLRTDLAICGSTEFVEAIKVLHPTPALGGAPRDSALHWLRKLGEPGGVERRYFGAPFGVYDPGRSGLAVVSIRQIFWQGGRTYLPTGCGVVAKSDLRKEWEELQLKRRSVQDAMGIG
jgi:isochorismate synthase EntC